MPYSVMGISPLGAGGAGWPGGVAGGWAKSELPSAKNKIQAKKPAAIRFIRKPQKPPSARIPYPAAEKLSLTPTPPTRNGARLEEAKFCGKV